MFLDVTPEALDAASAQVAAITSQLVAANAVHAATTGAITPPGLDLPSIKVAGELIGKGVEHELAATLGNVELAGSSMGLGESGVGYQVTDDHGAAAYTIAGGL